MSVFDELEVKNAIITGASIRVDRGFILTAYLNLDYGGSGQSFGGYVLGGVGGNSKAAEHGSQPNLCGHFIARVLEIVGVSDWGDLVGKTIRVRAMRSGVKAIGHIVSDKWFTPDEEFNDMPKDLIK